MSNEERSRHCPVWDHHFIPLGRWRVSIVNPTAEWLLAQPRRSNRGADYSKLGLRLDALAAFFQPRDCFANHAVAEMALRYAKQFRSRPFLLNFLDVCQTRDQIELDCHKEHATPTA